MNGRRSRMIRKQANLTLGVGTNKNEPCEVSLSTGQTVSFPTVKSFYRALKRQYKRSRRNLS